jgi:hypothetical protein
VFGKVFSDRGKKDPEKNYRRKWPSEKKGEGKEGREKMGEPSGEVETCKKAKKLGE